MKYLVTTNLSEIPPGPIAMLDGTVPGWMPKEGDLHYDHHRPDGDIVQIDGMGDAPTDFVGTIVTTLLDADAIVAAAWLQLSADERVENWNKLWAIAHDCDYLESPMLPDFAMKAVAAMKIRAGQHNKDWDAKQKSEWYSENFERSVNELLSACRGQSKWPGQSGEADNIVAEWNRQAQELINTDRVSYLSRISIIDLRGLGYIDPRAQQMAACRYINSLLPPTIAVCDHKSGGIKYTLGSIPSLARNTPVDYTKRVYLELNKLEACRRGIEPSLVQEHYGQPTFESAVGFSPWGGRATVGGSGLNTPSLLLPHQIANVLYIWGANNV
jgi:hypothetical protein